MCAANGSVDESEACVNTSPNSECEYWSTMGECDSNPDFMHKACMRACGLCTQQKKKDDSHLYDDLEDKDEL